MYHICNANLKLIFQKILKSNAFTLHNISNGVECDLFYSGPNYALIDEKVDCVLPIRDGNQMILSPNETCKANHDDSIFRYWRKTCRKSYAINPADVIQIKATNDY